MSQEVSGAGQGLRDQGIPWGTMAMILPREVPAMTASSSPEIHCLKCKVRTGSGDTQAVTLKNGAQATRAFCVDCGTQKLRMGPAG